MGQRYKLKSFLVKQLAVSNKIAQSYLEEQLVKVNGIVVSENCFLTEFDNVKVKDLDVGFATEAIYIAYNKPRGIECTLNLEVENNLKTAINIQQDFFPIGRLDKESDGLLLLTNDGRIYDRLLNKSKEVEKIYLVEVDKEITSDLVYSLQNGVSIMGRLTLPCKVNQISPFVFEITLVEGLNRQIRRMCYKSNYKVMRLGRIQFADYKLEQLELGTWKFIEKREIASFL